jgi:hypothetical protein
VVLYADTYHNGIIPQNIGGVGLRDLMIKQMSFPGYTGTIEFSAGRPDILEYGEGDREIGVRFQVSNFQKALFDNGSLASAALRRVGTRSGNLSRGSGFRSGFPLCGNDSTLHIRVTGGCHNIIYYTVNNNRPRDRPRVLTHYMMDSNKIGLYVMAAINLGVVVFFMIILFLYRRTRLLKASQPNMMWIIITANLFNVAR